MALGVPLFEADTPAHRVAWYRRLLGLATLVLWIATLVYFGRFAAEEQSPETSAALAIFVALFAAVYSQVLVVRWSGARAWRRLRNRMHGSVYISDVAGLPNRNYLLAELRREMPRSRETGKPFVVVVVSVDGYEHMKERRGEEFAARVLGAAGATVQQVTRKSDFVAYLGGADFGILLNECTLEQSYKYSNRVPAEVEVEHRRQRYPVTLGIRAAAYDMESLYATDVLREAEKAPPIRQGSRQRIERAI